LNDSNAEGVAPRHQKYDAEGTTTNRGERLHSTNEEDKRIQSLRKNYALESLPNISCWKAGRIALLRLKCADRRSLTKTIVSKGVVSVERE
jgi:hypothetical protein